MQEDRRDFPLPDSLYGNNVPSIWPMKTMRMAESLVSVLDTCRLCMVKGGAGSTMESIFLNEETNLIALQIIWVTQLKLQYGDGLPSQVCQQCIFQLNVAHNFKQRCVASDKALRQLHSEKIEATNIASSGLNRSSESVGTIEADNLILKAEPLSPCNFDETNNDQSDHESNTFNLPRDLKIEVEDHHVDDVIKSENKTIEETECIVNQEIVTEGKSNKKTVKKNGLHVCETCNKSYATWDLLRRHRRYHREKNLPCPKCDMKFLRPAGLKRHMGIHTNVRDFKCPQCDARFRAKTTLDIHVRSHSGVKLFGCHLCEKSFAHKSTLTTHIRVAHDNYKPYKCTYCPIAFAAKGSLTKHTRIHTNCRPNACKQCPKAFTTAAGLRNHVRIHNNERPYKCTYPDCGKAFTQLPGLIVHRLIHTGEKPWKCNFPDCVKTFVQKGTLNIHMRMHYNVRPYVCDICDKRFYTKKSLGRHIQEVHLFGFKNHQCKVCNKVFARDCGLAAHMNIHTDSRPFKCTHQGCLKTFRQRTSMLTHLRTHTGDKRYECSVCQMRFVQKSTLTTHFRVHSKEKPFKCKLCKQSFAQSGNLKDHIKRHHTKREKNRCKQKLTKPKLKKSKKQEMSIKVEEITIVECFDVKYEPVETNVITDYEVCKPTDKVYTCELCFDTFPKKHSLISHVKNKHSFDDEEVSEDNISEQKIGIVNETDSINSILNNTQCAKTNMKSDLISDELINSIAETDSTQIVEADNYTRPVDDQTVANLGHS